MLLGTHVLAGMVIYQAADPVRPKWLRWGVALTGGFLSHWVLDSLSVFHKFQVLDSWAIAAISVQAISMTFILLVLWANSRLVPYLLAGLWAWLSWDWEHLYIALLHKTYAAEILHCQTALIGIFPRHIKPSPEWTTLIEIGLVILFGLTIVMRKASSKVQTKTSKLPSLESKPTQERGSLGLDSRLL